MTTTFGGPALSSSESNSPVVVAVHTCLPDADRVIVPFSSLDASGEGDEGLVGRSVVTAVVVDWGEGEGCAAEEGEEGWSGVW